MTSRRNWDKALRQILAGMGRPDVRKTPILIGPDLSPSMTVEEIDRAHSDIEDYLGLPTNKDDQ